MPEQQNIEYKLIAMKKQIEILLYKALLLDGEMEQGLYEFELEEHIAYWKDGLKYNKSITKYRMKQKPEIVRAKE